MLYAGSSYFESSITTDENILHTRLKNTYFFNRRVLLQLGVLKLLLSKDTLVLELNPRILSNWILLLVRRPLRLETIVWGHAWPREGRESKTDRVRHIMRGLATGIVVYTAQQKTALKQKMPTKKIVAAPNALYTSNQMVSLSNDPKHFIYVGRLTKAKKPFFLTVAFARIIPDLLKETKLFIVGEGPEREKIKLFIEQNSLSEQIKLLGHISDFKELKRLYAKSIFSISPGYVGLSITQSLGFGVPMLISREESHSPEIEAAIEGENALFYSTDDELRFRESVLKIFKNQEIWIAKRKTISEFCKTNYSVEAMVAVFCNLIKS